MALDEPRENDEVFLENGVTFVIDKETYARTQPITVDYVTTEQGGGFAISSSLNHDKSCGSCC